MAIEYTRGLSVVGIGTYRLQTSRFIIKNLSCLIRKNNSKLSFTEVQLFSVFHQNQNKNEKFREQTNIKSISNCSLCHESIFMVFNQYKSMFFRGISKLLRNQKEPLSLSLRINNFKNNLLRKRQKSICR